MLNVSPTKVTQSLDPAVTKLAKLFRADPAMTLRMLIEAADALDPMSEQEWELRRLIQIGRADTRQTHPHASSPPSATTTPTARQRNGAPALRNA